MIRNRCGQHRWVLGIIKIGPYRIRGPDPMGLDILDGNVEAERQGGSTPSEGVETVIP